MTLPASGTIYMSQIATEFYAKWGNVSVYNLNSYRGFTYYSAPVNGSLIAFPSGTIYMSNFYGTNGVCACDCVCDCACACSNGG